MLSLHQFPKTAKAADGSVVGLFPFLFAFLEEAGGSVVVLVPFLFASLEDGHNHSLSTGSETCLSARAD